jgi:hypothetical protein
MHTKEEIRVQVTTHPAVTILEQLGGNRFVAMTGAKEFVSADTPLPQLRFRLPSNATKGRGTHMEVILLPTDEYLLVFYKLRKGERDFICPSRTVQVEGLRRSFEEMTGLYTAL